LKVGISEILPGSSNFLAKILGDLDIEILKFEGWMFGIFEKVRQQII